MTEAEFRSKIPYIIKHPAHGNGELVIRNYKKNNKKNISVGYRHEDSNNFSYGTNGYSFLEIYESLYPFLLEKNMILKSN